MIARSIAASLAALMSLALAGCAGVTYGTGTRAEMQTLEDISGIASIGGKKQAEIEYRPRGGIVVPPSNNLPPPGDSTKVAAADGNWPVDQDKMAKKIREDRVAAGNTAPGADPGFRLPPGSTARTQAEADKEGFKKLAAAKAGTSAVDANGKPVRRFLTEPPSEYREGDPNAATATAEAPKKKKGWWPFGS